MSDPGSTKKSRRRFLADMLFLGGGLSAAGLLAKAGMSPEVTAPPSPQLSGKVASPTQQCSPIPNAPVPGEAVAPGVPDPVATQTPEAPPPPVPTVDLPPGVEGEMIMPSPAPAIISPSEPNPRGGRVAPRLRP